jgi:hypothetical protein
MTTDFPPKNFYFSGVDGRQPGPVLLTGYPYAYTKLLIFNRPPCWSMWRNIWRLTP